MKRKIILSVALTLSVILLSLTSSDSRVEAQNQIKVVADTGVITLGANQKLRVTSAWDLNNDGSFSFKFGQTKYQPDACSGGVCKVIAVSHELTAPITLAPGEAASLDVTDDNPIAARVIVLSNKQNVRVNVSIIDEITGATITSYSFGVSNTG